MIKMIRLLIAPIRLRFHSTESLLDALDMLERSYTGPKSSLPKAELENALCLIARELIRRKIIFWA